MITVIYLVYSIVDGLNDPIIGYLTDRSTRYTSKFGKRFPYIMIGVISCPILLIICFIPITNNMTLAAIWLAIMMIIYESALTLYEVNHDLLFPDLFRELSDRRKLTGLLGVITGIVAIATALIVPTLISSFGGLSSTAYLTAVFIIIIIVFIFIVPYSFGIREPADMKTFRTELDSEKKGSSSVKNLLSRIFRDRNWMAITLTSFLYSVGGVCISYGLNFFVVHNLGLSIGATAFPIAVTGIVSLCFAPIWAWIAKRTGVKKAYLIGLIIIAACAGAFIFFTDLLGTILVFAFIGVAYSGTFTVVYKLLYAEGIDNAALKTGRREEGSYNGILRVFTAFSYFFQTLIFSIISGFTGYDPALGTANSDLAKFGLKFQMSIIPMIIILIAILIFGFMYKISKEDAENNKINLIERGL